MSMEMKAIMKVTKEVEVVRIETSRFGRSYAVLRYNGEEYQIAAGESLRLDWKMERTITA